jgi:uncharacterized protein YukE
MCGVWDRRPSNVAAEPLASLLESFAGAIASVQWRWGGVAGVGEAFHRWQRPSLDRIRVRMSVG